MKTSKAKWEYLSHEEILKAYEENTTRCGFSKALGYSSTISPAQMKLLCETHGLDEAHFNYHAGKDITGQIFGKLKALELDVEKSKEMGIRYWKCLCLGCDEGNIVSVRLSNLTSGEVQSCGCLKGKKNREDISGQVFGYLKAIEVDEKKTKEKSKLHWKCQCLKCGRPDLVSVSATHLKTGHTKTCGCMNSAVEDDIRKILEKYNYDFEQQYTFNDLKGIKDTGTLRFDFAIFNDENELACLLEYNGIQHYEPRSGFGGEQALKDQQKRDKKKIEYCKEKNIPLIILNNKTGHEEQTILDSINYYLDENNR